MRAVIAALLLLAASLIVNVSTVSAGCATAYATLDDGSGHQIRIGSGGYCSNPEIYDWDLRAAKGTCVGQFNIAHSDWNDCANFVRFTGFPAGTVLRVYRDSWFGGVNTAFACQNTWYNLGSYPIGADQASSLRSFGGSGSCT